MHLGLSKTQIRIVRRSDMRFQGRIRMNLTYPRNAARVLAFATLPLLVPQLAAAATPVAAGAQYAQYYPPPHYPPPGYYKTARPPCPAVTPGPFSGAARGAAGGAIFGAIGGNAGAGAAIGAGIGMLAGAARHATARSAGHCY